MKCRYINICILYKNSLVWAIYFLFRLSSPPTFNIYLSVIVPQFDGPVDCSFLLLEAYN